LTLEPGLPLWKEQMGHVSRQTADEGNRRRP